MNRHFCNNAHFLSQLKGKKVFYRIDGNVDIYNGIIHNDFRLKAVLPTLTLLQKADAHITIATHRGRPKGIQQQLSTAPLQAWFAAQGFSEIKVLENLRFHEGERSKNPAVVQAFAQELAQGMDYYINDAWGLLHRNDTSITVLPTLFTPERRALGLLIEQELSALAPLKQGPEQPYLIILGGGKVETKLPIIERLLTKYAHCASTTKIIILPALSSTFLHAQGIKTGTSLVQADLVAQAQAILTQADKLSIELIFPEDYLCLSDNELAIVSASSVPEGSNCISVGPRSLEKFKAYIRNAHTIFFNGAMGFPDQPETMQPVDEILRMIAQSDAYSVIGGGSSVAEVEKCGLLSAMDYCSTGGGSTLTYISDGHMPGLEALQN